MYIVSLYSQPIHQLPPLRVLHLHIRLPTGLYTAARRLNPGRIFSIQQGIQTECTGSWCSLGRSRSWLNRLGRLCRLTSRSGRRDLSGGSLSCFLVNETSLVRKLLLSSFRSFFKRDWWWNDLLKRIICDNQAASLPSLPDK